MTTLATAIALVLLIALSVFQLALACGAPLGHYAWGGQHRVLPATLRVGSAASIAIYALIALVLLDRGGSIDLFSQTFSTYGPWVITVYFVVGIAMNAISRSRPERLTMTPVCLVLATCSAVIALS